MQPAKYMTDEERERDTLPPSSNDAFEVVLAGLRQVIRPLEGKVDKLTKNLETFSRNVEKRLSSLEKK